MPAKKKDCPQYKPFIGRIFTLRQHKTMPCYHDNKERIEVCRSDFGDVVLVTDETNTRVKVTLSTGSFTWIPKFFLHTEIKNDLFESVDELAICIQKLLKIAEELRNNEEQLGKFTIYAEDLQQVAVSLKHYTDCLNPIKGRL